MRIVSLALQDWRNITQARIETDARYVVLHGENGHGKTNVLEAVWMLATLRGFRDNRPSRLVRHGAEQSRLIAGVQTSAGHRKLEWRRDRKSRRLSIDDSTTTQLSTWFSLIRSVLFCPQHLNIVRGGPDQRRQFLDRAAFTARPRHLDVVRAYGRAVKQKAALLQSGRASEAELSTWNTRLVELGTQLIVRRWQALDELSAPFSEMHQAVAGVGEVRLEMMGCTGGERDPQAIASALERALEDASVRELDQRRVWVGPHRDDLQILLDGRQARHYASQGQARSIVLALKLAELQAAHVREQVPMFLLDDLTGELDGRRMARLVEQLAGLPNQVWVTTTDPAYLGPLPTADSARYRLMQGTLQAS